MSQLQNFLKSNRIYKPIEINIVLQAIHDECYTVSINRKGKFYNIPCAFDIETTSTYINGEKVAIMYEWTLGLDGLVIIGRTWDEYKQVIDIITDALQLGDKRKLIIYVHNLSFEFQFLRKHFEWSKVFATKSRTPIYALDVNGIEYRCSYILSGYNLQTLAEQIPEYGLKKLVGDLDYTKVRHNKTPLTKEETAYCVNDVKIVMAYIDKCINESGNIAKIPYTKTSYVRNYCRQSCFYESGESRKQSKKYWRYRKLMSNLTLEPDEYLQLKRAFQGGFTHANAFYVGQKVGDVTSYDFTSSYPAVMVAEKFPMSKGEKVIVKTKAEFEHNLKYYCCLFDVEFIGLESKLSHENYISKSRCQVAENATINNGRVARADRIITTITEQDYMIIRKYYTWDKMYIGTFRRYQKDYLPTDFVKSILKLYVDKTTLKGVSGKENEYMVSKGMLNSCYGMSVTDIVRDDIEYTDEWTESKPNLDEQIEKYNNSKSRFLFYPWGVWVTAYSRKNLFTGITHFGADYIYSDTDSIKVVNADKPEHQEYITKYNDVITRMLENACKYHNIDTSSIFPKTVKGIEKPLGVWDYDGHYDYFKTLGAKRYLTQEREAYKLTVSGLNKKYAMDHLQNVYGKDVFNAFSDKMHIDGEHTGKLTHSYIDNEFVGYVTDYTGQTALCHELSGVHLEKAEFTLSLASDYIRFIDNVMCNGLNLEF